MEHINAEWSKATANNPTPTEHQPTQKRSQGSFADRLRAFNLTKKEKQNEKC